ncbi:MAG TPA: tripartite tricarboxylate transporter substrate-binding protein [Burkholderiaceae bacterium]|nr:tripartite tricarboxylate transporter substrate-binding protein [Burkholderiaceae bacterium]
MMLGVGRYVVALAALLCCLGVHARDYPARPVRIVVPFPPGGAVDNVARLLGERLGVEWKQPVVIENRPGANGSIGTRAAASASADGYTLLLSTSSTQAVNPALEPTLPYDPVNDFSHIFLIGSTPNILYVHPSLAVSDVQGLIRAARDNPDKFAIGYGTSSAMVAGDLFQTMAGIRLTNVAYKGNPQVLTDLIAGRVHAIFAVPSSVPAGFKDKLVPVAVTSLSRLRSEPDLPTVHESGLRGYEAVGWFGISAPVGVEDSVRRKINEDLNRVLGSQEVRERLMSLEVSPIGGTEQQFTGYVKSELSKWREVVGRAAGQGGR